MKLLLSLIAALLTTLATPAQALGGGYWDRMVGWYSQHFCASNNGAYDDCPRTTASFLDVATSIDRGWRGTSFETVHGEIGPNWMHASGELSSVPNWDHMQGYLHMGQFDTMLVQGPGSGVQLNLAVRVQTVAEDRPNLSQLRWGLHFGWRKNHAPCGCAADLEIDPMGWIPASGSPWTYSWGAVQNPSDTQYTGSIWVPVGQAFDLGTKAYIDMAGLKLDVDIRWDYALPDGYSMTSARGLHVNTSPVPEPATAWLWLAALPLWAARRLRNRL